MDVCHLHHHPALQFKPRLGKVFKRNSPLFRTTTGIIFKLECAHIIPSLGTEQQTSSAELPLESPSHWTEHTFPHHPDLVLTLTRDTRNYRREQHNPTDANHTQIKEFSKTTAPRQGTSFTVGLSNNRNTMQTDSYCTEGKTNNSDQNPIIIIKEHKETLNFQCTES